jgi:hypothetical protein
MSNERRLAMTEPRYYKDETVYSTRERADVVVMEDPVPVPEMDTYAYWVKLPDGTVSVHSEGELILPELGRDSAAQR